MIKLYRCSYTTAFIFCNYCISYHNFIHIYFFLSFFFQLSSLHWTSPNRMSTTNLNSIPKKDNYHSSNWTVNKSVTRPPSSRSSHKSSTRTSMLDWARSRKTFLMQWFQWLKIIWLSSSCHGEQRTPVKWSMDTRSISSSHSAAKSQMHSWVSSSNSTMVIEYVKFIWS